MEREILDLDVLYIGAGPASMASALHLKKQLAEAKIDATIGIIEKSREIGAHSMSGAILDPISIKELYPNFIEMNFPIESMVKKESMYYLTNSKKFKFPYIPKAMSHHECYIVSIGKLTRWLGEQCEKEGIDIFCGFSGSEILYKDENVIGVRTGDLGIDKNGNEKANYMPGMDIHAKITVLGEGTRGNLSKSLISKFNLMENKNPQVWALGVKELWKMPNGTVPDGYVAHTMGFPLGHDIFGGAFLYGMKNDIWNLGIVVGLDYTNSGIDPHHELQLLKSHPWLQSLLEKGEMISYGAKSLPEGGWFSLPKLTVNGAMLIGDSAGFLNGQRLKGIHLAIKSGMLAAETICESIQINDQSDVFLSKFENKIEKSWLGKELKGVRNFHQAFDHGLIPGVINSVAGLFTGGRGWGYIDRLKNKSGHSRIKKIKSAKNVTNFNKYDDIKYDGKYFFDKVTNVYHSQTAHDEDQIPHLHILDQNLCITRCTEEYGNPCQNFCPADVYEMTENGENKKLQINFSNCVHCKTCDIMDPYQIINWVPPEGGDGPMWKIL